MSYVVPLLVYCGVYCIVTFLPLPHKCASSILIVKEVGSTLEVSHFTLDSNTMAVAHWGRTHSHAPPPNQSEATTPSHFERPSVVTFLGY